ncbi:aspartyl-phosphate phosphatase Spo0E family protein [Neobacillus cucumis]|uniref:aspartyl-phosphate phosphatase Spo0E family protein n=1 Tax=Neobacillus cucumis TaxID=1740721 RepID=UPI002852FC10|nr:aspartyl-phosphate phosphatase Spo0E family protein [Neobacillus cucumis]MDR4946471.1 aspartyl-phosphate phosphatase Spo0E family protein [Neobacillus cucumis]
MTINGTINEHTSVDLRKYIEFLRKKLIDVGLQCGLSSKEAITISQELDQYILICQKCCQRKNVKNTNQIVELKC